jgi:O-antigen/teichoic acid export membrane protein
MLTTTLLPAFSHVQADKDRVNRMLSEVTSWVILLGLPAVAMIWLCGPSLLTITYGARYAASAGALSLAAGVALLNTLNAQVTILFYAAGRPALHRRAVAASAIVMMIAIYPACKYMGLVGGQVAALLAIAASYILQIARARNITGLSLLQYGRAFVPAALVSAGILIVGIGVRSLGLATRPVNNIAVAVIACIVAYALSVPAFIRTRETA